MYFGLAHSSRFAGMGANVCYAIRHVILGENTVKTYFLMNPIDISVYAQSRKASRFEPAVTAYENYQNKDSIVQSRLGR